MRNKNFSEFNEWISSKTNDLKKQILSHKIYDIIEDESNLKIFLKYHIFSVWDFQSLLNALQRKFTSVSNPWIPTNDTLIRRLVNEIVLDEESAKHPYGGYSSHFELYLDAMKNCEADTSMINNFLEALKSNLDLDNCIHKYVPLAIQPFLNNTFELINNNNEIELMASFTYGREDIIPSMFSKLLKNSKLKIRKNGIY